MRLEKRIIGLETEYGSFSQDLARSRDGEDGHHDAHNNRLIETIREARPRSGNSFLLNGGRMYEDCGHIEYCTPETTNPVDLVLYEKAGERLLNQHSRGVMFIKNNVAANNSTFGCHENYLIKRPEHFINEVGRYLMSFLVTRQIYAGTGDIYENKFRISQKSRFITENYGKNTTRDRPIINLKDESHCGGKESENYRLHLILGDSNLSEIATYLKVGTTSLVLDLIEDGICPYISLYNPVYALHEISQDLTFKIENKINDSRPMTAINIQRQYLKAAKKAYTGRDEITDDILARWEYVLDCLETDPMKLDTWIDWVIKKSLIDKSLDKNSNFSETIRKELVNLQQKIASAYQKISESKTLLLPDNQIIRADNLLIQAMSSITNIIDEDVYSPIKEFVNGRNFEEFDVNKISKNISYKYHSTDPNNSLFYFLQNNGMIDRLVSDEQITHAVNNPPQDTRAWVRAKILSEIRGLGGSVEQMDWSAISVYHPNLSGGRVMKPKCARCSADCKGYVNSNGKEFDLTDPFDNKKQEYEEMVRDIR